jgi:2-polyprenyl-3-methyl-5-hydroxy-6-metoxy-1,4-benzoquinol methylase
MIERVPYAACPLCSDATTADYRSADCTAHPLYQSALPERCAVVSMADVLEHMPSPAEGLRAAHRLLVDDGVLLASMPNTESFVWRVLDKNGVNPYWGEIEHYHAFSRNRFCALLRDTGFEPARYGVSERYRACMEVVARRR